MSTFSYRHEDHLRPNGDDKTLDSTWVEWVVLVVISAFCLGLMGLGFWKFFELIGFK